MRPKCVLSSAPYATADKHLGLRSVVDRLYRGPCRTVDEFEKVAAGFRDARPKMLAQLDTIKDLDRSVKNEMKDYLDEFFRQIEKPDSIRKTFVNGCKPQPNV